MKKLTKISNWFSDFWRKIIANYSVENLKNQMICNSIKRKSIFLKRNLYINNIETKIKIIWLKNDQMINDYLVKTKELDCYTCYFVNKQIGFDSFQFQTNYDLVITNLTWEIIELHPNFKINTKLPMFNRNCHLFLLSKNSINVLSLKLSDTISTIQIWKK